jgi:hypothetical protein
MRYFRDDPFEEMFDTYMSRRGPQTMRYMEDPLEKAKAGIRFYKAIIAEEKRKLDKETKEKKEKEAKHWAKKVLPSGGTLAFILFWTWPLLAIYTIYAVKFILHSIGVTTP